MRFKLICVLANGKFTDLAIEAATQVGATGYTIINQVRGGGLGSKKSLFGLVVQAPRDLVLMLVEERLARPILENIALKCEFDSVPDRGIAFQLNVEDIVGFTSQINALTPKVESEI